MGVLDRYRANRGIATILAATGRTPGALAAAALVRALGKNAVPRLIDALPRDQSGLIAELLGEVLTNATLPQLVEAGLLSENPLMVSSARRALACARQIDPNRLLEVVLAKGGSIADIADVLLRCKDAVSAKSMLRLLDQARADNHPGTFKLIDQIANPSMTAPLVGFLKNANWQARVQVASTIARFPSEPVRDALVRLLADPDKNVRQAALEGLGALNMPVPIGPVCALLRDPDLLVQAKAIETAVRLNDPESFRHLLPILQDESEHARRAAVEVLNAIGNANVVKDLLSALKDQDWWVRVRAADALGAIGGPAVIEAVLGLLGDPDEFMRRTAVEILNTTKDERAFQHLVRALGDADWWVRERAVDALGNLGDARAVPHLARLLRSDSQAAPAAIRALAALGDPAAVDDLIEILASPDPAVQREALEALRALATPAHAEAIRRALGELTPAAADIQEIAQRLAHQAADPAHARGGSSAPGAGRNTGAGPAHARGGAREPLRALAAPRALAAGPAPANAEMTLERPMQPPETGAGSPAPVQAAPERTVARDPAPGAPGVRPAAAQGIDLTCIEPGQVLAGRYKVVRELGRGGFGTVLQVEDQVVGEAVALKLINPQLVQDQGTIARFVHEVRYARRVTHENVIRIHDFQVLGNVCAISMEYFASHPLARPIRLGLARNPARGLHLVRCVARGMHVAHQAEIMHRDLKPANILVDDGNQLKIVDFGLAAACSSTDSRITRTGHLIGTPTYMSPEQARGLAIDARTDIYSLGVIMYEVFTGFVPYAGDNPFSVLYQHMEGLREPPRARNPGILPAIEAIIVKAMATDPAARYQSAGEMLAALDAVDLRLAA